MLFFLFQILDLFTAVVLVMAQYDVASTTVLLYHSSYLIAKGLWYWRTWVSWVDIFIGIYLILMVFGVKSMLSYVAAVWFLYKFSLFFIYW